MKVILIEWNSYGNENMLALMKRRGYEVITCPFDGKKYGLELDAEINRLTACLNKNTDADYVFSFNYVPAISNVCQGKNIYYISWIYDSPFMNIYSYTVTNPVNRIFVFDYSLYQEFEAAKIDTVFYLPLGIDEVFLEKKCGSIDEIYNAEDKSQDKYACDISFVGSLYTEAKHRLYEKFSSLDSYSKGYLDAIINAQKQIYGEDILSKLLTPETEEKMQKVYPTDPNSQTVMTPKQIYTEFVLARQVTTIERREILQLIGELGVKNNLYTNDLSVRIGGWNNKGAVDYYDEMPLVFKNSKINLNITLRSIHTGIPLRVFDILGAGGFLITNYQSELLEYFVPGEDLVIYESYEDLIEKIKYYLEHDDERKRIAENGCRKVRENHTFSGRLDLMEETLK